MTDTWIADLLASFRPVRLRRIFSGRSIYAGELITATEFGGSIWLKADEATRPMFVAAGSTAFIYEKNGKAYEMAYWARLAEATSRRAQAPRIRARPKA